MRPWAAVDEEALELLFPHMPRPWPDEVAAAWLRYSHAAAQHGRCYWLPGDATAQVVAAMRRRDSPGRVALSQVTGWTEKRARILLERATWIDPIQAKRQPAEAVGGGRAGARVGPASVQGGAGLRLVNAGLTVKQGPASVQGGAGLGPPQGPYARVSFEPETQNPEPNTPLAAGAAVGCAAGPEPVSDRPASSDTTAPGPAPVADRDRPSPIGDAPAQARPAKGLSPADRATLAATVVEVEGLVEGVTPSASSGPIRRLHRALGCPDLAGLCAEVALVGRWARESSEPRAARHLRGVGMGGADQSRSLTTLCSPDRWAERLQAARRWAATKTTTPAASPGPSAEQRYREACIEALLEGAPETVMAPVPRGLDGEAASRAREAAGREWQELLPAIDLAQLEASRAAWQARADEETRRQLRAMGVER